MLQQTFGLGAHLFVKVPRPRDSEETFFRSSSPAATCTTSLITLKVAAIPLSGLLKDITSELTFLSSQNLFLCWTSSREAVNTYLRSLLVWLGQKIEPRSTDYEADVF